jgi:hypothetical protein
LTEDKEVSVQLSVIEYVRQAIERERELTKQKLKRILDRVDSIEGAREVASETIKEQKVKDDAEYHRRLGELNHEKERLAASQNASVSREVFETRNREVDNWRSGIDKTLANYAGRIVMLAAFVVVIDIAIKLFLRK